MCHPTRCHGVVAINCSAAASLGRFLDKLRVGAFTPCSIHPKYPEAPPNCLIRLNGEKEEEKSFAQGKLFYLCVK